MTLPELLGNEALRNHEFPVTRNQRFFAHAAVCPLPRRVAEAISTCALAGSTTDQEEAVARPIFQETRAAAASLLHAQPTEIALVGPTSQALSLIAAGLPWRRHDSVLIYHDDYPANVYPWMALADKGVEVRLLNVREYGKIRAIDVEGQVDERTRLVALASCHFISGWRLNLPAIGKALHRRGVLFCVDGIQTLGAFPTTVEHIDFLAADAHKWLLGPCAAGLLYVRQDLQDRVRPALLGWHNVRCPNFVAQENMVFRPDARRYEAGTGNLLGAVGLKAALELQLEIGPEAIATELLRKRTWLAAALQEKGYTVLQAGAPADNAGPMLSFHRPETDLAALHAKLLAANIIVSLRTDRQGQHYLRVAPHFYNTDEELQGMLNLL